jgi:tRNA-2-methylthio-N6-dimethylallyladenosine synthase
MSDHIDEHLKEERNQDLLEVVNKSNRQILERLVGSQVEVLCQGPSKTNRARLMGRTRTNKIVVFPPSPSILRSKSTKDEKRRPTGESEELVGELVNVRIERANGFSLYGIPRNTGILPVPASGHPAGRQRTLEACMTRQAGSLSYEDGQSL